ncbi:hypothetical protein THAOC_35795 [Thalassiosira oceanica]|uniref:Uncharacterized protein n=1 Tax=Thalassiosira oceanica TaxID=159749 RepID=K0R0C3_THAOC|nr:hypothetical protein THAOC_35795 [Thalassiosira oceanica]|eukprot:EJK45583.1 hypothetical protein THAOC_35795 [Thalassiosira oceanica]
MQLLRSSRQRFLAQSNLTAQNVNEAEWMFGGGLGDAPSLKQRTEKEHLCCERRAVRQSDAGLNRMPDRVDGDEGGVDAAASRDEADRADESAGDEAEADREIAASGLTSIFQKGTPNATKSGSIAVLLLLLLLLSGGAR